MIVKKHFVVFMSPGTLVAETSQKPIDSWDTDKAIEIAKDIVERHSARPFGFQFTTRERKDCELDSRETKRSGMYFLGGTVLTLQDVKDRQGSDDSILIRNMERNGYDRVVENTNSWTITLPLQADDVVLDIPADLFPKRQPAETEA